MVNTDRIANDWKRRGYSFGEFRDPPGQRWEDFVHEVDELFMVAEGRMEIEIEGAVSHPDPGEEVFIPARAVHSVRNIGGTSACWLYGYKQKP
ncbi:cupin domain-containing protein [Nitrospina gracilis]|uniref:cupin domain-containing protein n=1 Tax=Nitrospina gracilis TaxID=35801 RepID=UPI001F2BBF20|nr:cupin domain-containing protein [Nitrospina gracilis]MCF8721712.1 mannose-6-phosphate isomerase-like protein (cupin superfamily) [Nitrospina gracilis Nb-211]